MAKKVRDDVLSEEKQRQQQEEERLRQEESEKSRRREELRAMAKQQEIAERNIMDCLVETDTEDRALENLAQIGLDVSVWSLRYMVVERLGRQILIDADYTQEELQQWLIPYALGDEKSYVRRAAIKHLTDIEALAKSSSGDAEPIVRKKAIEQLFKFLDQAAALEALNVVSLSDSVSDLRHMAVLRIVDQDVIAKVAKEDVEPVIRQSATKKLTSQDALAWLTINDPTQLVRSTAAELMTDVTALVKAASQPKAGEATPEAEEAAVEEAAAEEAAAE